MMMMMMMMMMMIMMMMMMMISWPCTGVGEDHGIDHHQD
jgi:hypothetical protein